MEYFVFIIPFFFLAMALEFWLGYRKSQKLYRLNDTITNLNIGIGNRVVSVFSKGLLLGIYIYFYEHFALFEIPNTLLAGFVCLVLFDFLYYWAHRWSHEINFFWGAHVVHHQSEEYNLSVALRQSWIHDLIAFFIFLPLPILGFSPTVFFPAALLVTLYQFWIHTKAIDKLHPIVEFILNTPSHHRVHHGVNPKYIDKNHAAVFIIWDRIFGTYQDEEEEPTYGITTPLKSWNPAWANSHYYIELFEQAKQMNNWKDRFKIIFAKPGWLPDYLGGVQEVPPVDAVQKKYDERVSASLNYYVLVQYLSITFGLVLFMIHFENLSLFYKVVFAGLIFLSVVICGGLMEDKSWTIWGEYTRLFVLLFSLNSLYYLQYISWFKIMLIASSFAFVLLVLWFTISWRKSILIKN